LPDTATPTAVRTPGTRRASNAHTALARDRARSRNSLTGPAPAPPTHVMLSPAVRVAANAAT
jgi:hypothetical protein